MVQNENKIISLTCNFAFNKNQIDPSLGINVVRVNCIGEIDPTLVFDIFIKGGDGVIMAGCKKPDCHFLDGNVQGERTATLIKKLLSLAGLESERLRLIWDSPAEESLSQFKDFQNEIAKMGASPLKNATPESPLMINMLAAKKTAADFRSRVLLGGEKKLVEDKNSYGEKITQSSFELLLTDVVQDELIRNRILQYTKNKSLSVKDLAPVMKLPSSDVLKQIVNLRRKNLIALDNIDGTSPKYKALVV